MEITKERWARYIETDALADTAWDIMKQLQAKHQFRRAYRIKSQSGFEHYSALGILPIIPSIILKCDYGYCQLYQKDSEMVLLPFGVILNYLELVNIQVLPKKPWIRQT